MNPSPYDAWKAEPTPENMAKVLADLEPTINAEVYRHEGPKPLLKSRAKKLAIGAVKTYTPTQGAQLRSWVVTQLQPLSRYGKQLRPVKVPEMALRQAAEVDRLSKELSSELGYDPTPEELADHIGISPKRIIELRKKVKPIVNEGAFAVDADASTTGSPAISFSNPVSTAEEAVYDSLDERDRAIFDMKIGRHGRQQLSNQEIAKRLGVTPALISQKSQAIAMQIKELSQKGIL